jgi:hypothetical protein
MRIAVGDRDRRERHMAYHVGANLGHQRDRERPGGP